MKVRLLLWNWYLVLKTCDVVMLTQSIEGMLNSIFLNVKRPLSLIRLLSGHIHSEIYGYIFTVQALQAL